MTMIATGGESEGTFSESEMRTQALSSPRKERKDTLMDGVLLSLDR